MKKDNYAKSTRKTKIVFGIVGVFFFIYSLTYLVTFGWAFINSLKDKLEFIRYPLEMPKKLHFENYVNAFDTLKIGENNLFNLLFNSIWFAGGATFINVLTTNATAYCVSKYRFKGRNIIYNVAIFTMLISVVGSLPATYEILGFLNILDTPLYLITYASGIGFNFLLMYGFYKNVSWEYAEAVFVDGGGHYTVFFKVMLPQSLPMCVALFIVQFIGLWNDYMTPLLFLRDFPTLASGLYLFQYVPSIRANYPLYYASILIATIPVVVLYSLFQESIMTNTVAGGLKG